MKKGSEISHARTDLFFSPWWSKREIQKIGSRVGVTSPTSPTSGHTRSDLCVMGQDHKGKKVIKKKQLPVKMHDCHKSLCDRSLELFYVYYIIYLRIFISYKYLRICSLSLSIGKFRTDTCPGFSTSGDSMP
jgi:hypothetical protein